LHDTVNLHHSPSFLDLEIIVILPKIAIPNPASVVIKALEMESEIVLTSAPVMPIELKQSIMPITVPSIPIQGKVPINIFTKAIENLGLSMQKNIKKVAKRRK